AYLNVPGLRVFVTGQRRADAQQTLGTTRATNATGLRVVFALLCKPEWLNAPYREINEAAGVALGAVGWVFNDLTARGLVIGDKRKGGRRFTDLKRLFTEWVTNYPLKLRPKLGPRRYHATDPQRWQQADIEKYRAYWGGEAAADRLTRFLKPEHATIYTRADPAELVVNFRLRPDPEGEIEILQAFWHPALDAETAATVPPVLVYADLMATLDPRNHDAAQMIYERYLASIIDQTG
ncbi:MAG TPA: type IV toxin-antitoxin system AbiEi family antitoxin, partial [Burkholderiales bacterium]|nr:type IV toxin-antitoxin system AbiEi family antitoxin [Burkholderiales bacterium]